MILQIETVPRFTQTLVKDSGQHTASLQCCSVLILLKSYYQGMNIITG